MGIVKLAVETGPKELWKRVQWFCKILGFWIVAMCPWLRMVWWRSYVLFYIVQEKFLGCIILDKRSIKLMKVLIIQVSSSKFAKLRAWCILNIFLTLNCSLTFILVAYSSINLRVLIKVKKNRTVSILVGY